jgi:hypothetical protein
MNIDDLKPQNVDTSSVNNGQVPSVPVETPVLNASPTPTSAPTQVAAPEPTGEIPMVPPVPIPTQTTTVQSQVTANQPPVEVQNQINPFSEPPAVAPVEEKSTVVSFTPVDKVVPSNSETIIAPTQQPVVENAPLPQSNSETPVVDAPAPLPPSPLPSDIPVNNQEVTVVNTSKRRSSSNIFLIILALGLVLFVLNIDQVITYVQENIITKNPTSPGNTPSNNLVEGFVRIDDSTSDYTIKDIRFYNFKKQPDNKLLINFTSTKNYTKVPELGIYIEIYNSNKEILSKHQFLEQSIGNSEVGSTILSLNESVYNYAYFAKVVVYTDEEKASTQTVTCTYNDHNENYLLEYNTKYNFVNNELNGYEVVKKLEIVNNNKATSTAISIIEKENSDVTKFEIPTKYENNVLTYSVDLNNVNEGYIPFYSKGTTPTIIRMNETAKKWICE